MPETTTIIDIIQRSGIVGLLILILVGGIKGWWVYGYIYGQAVKDRDEWRAVALQGTELAERALGTTTKAVRNATLVDSQPRPKRTRTNTSLANGDHDE